MSRYSTPVTHSLFTPDNLGTVTLTILGPHYDRAPAPGESFTHPATGNIYTGIMNQCWKWLYHFSERNRQRKKSMCFWTTSCVDGYPLFAQTLTVKTIQCWMQSVPNRSPTVIWRIGLFPKNSVRPFDESVHHPCKCLYQKSEACMMLLYSFPNVCLHIFFEIRWKGLQLWVQALFWTHSPVTHWHIFLHTQINTHNYTILKMRMTFLIIFASENK